MTIALRDGQKPRDPKVRQLPTDHLRRQIHEALDRVSRPAQQEVLLDFKMQAADGDPSPAVTVARARALRPESVRQTCKRVLDKVRRLADDDPYFAPLADLGLLRRAS